MRRDWESIADKQQPVTSFPPPCLQAFDLATRKSYMTCNHILVKLSFAIQIELWI